MRKIEDLVEDYRQDMFAAQLYGIKEAVQLLHTNVSICDNLNQNKIQAYEYVSNQCNSIINVVCEKCSYNNDYSPSMEECYDLLNRNQDIYGYYRSLLVDRELFYCFSSDEGEGIFNVIITDSNDIAVTEDDIHRAIMQYYDVDVYDIVRENYIYEYQEKNGNTVTDIIFEVENIRKKIRKKIQDLQYENVFLSGVFTTKTKHISVFSDFIIGNEKSKVINITKKNIEKRNGRSVSVLIKALESKGYIQIDKGKIKCFIDALINEYGDLGSYNNIKDYYMNKKGNPITDEEIELVKNKLE